jgi:predicted nucleic acid-binding protein
LPIDEAPLCRDKQYQIFLELAVAGEADALVTGDEDLLVLAGQSIIPIMTPADFYRRIGIKQKHH